MKNLKKISRELGENLSDEELQAMIDEFDKDQDGYSKILLNFKVFFWKNVVVNEEEFLGIMKQTNIY